VVKQIHRCYKRVQGVVRKNQRLKSRSGRLYKSCHQRGSADEKKEIARQMVNHPASPFTLTDLNGQSVSLSELKGKEVILDFWATWCVPCKASFPAMAAAQKKYSQDPNVKFLFIHTWEQSKDAAEQAKEYMIQQQYNFEVLMDLKDPVTKKNKVVESYGVTGIPAKFIVDPKGQIRFQLTGFSGVTEKAVDELSTMIELARSADQNSQPAAIKN